MNTRRTALPVIIALTAAVLAAGQAAGSVPEDGASSDPHALPLGPAGLTETRTTRTIQPGVTLTTIVRGVGIRTRVDGRDRDSVRRGLAGP